MALLRGSGKSGVRTGSSALKMISPWNIRIARLRQVMNVTDLVRRHSNESFAIVWGISRLYPASTRFQKRRPAIPYSRYGLAPRIFSQSSTHRSELFRGNGKESCDGLDPKLATPEKRGNNRAPTPQVSTGIVPIIDAASARLRS